MSEMAACLLGNTRRTCLKINMFTIRFSKHVGLKHRSTIIGSLLHNLFEIKVKHVNDRLKS